MGEEIALSGDEPARLLQQRTAAMARAHRHGGLDDHQRAGPEPRTDPADGVVEISECGSLLGVETDRNHDNNHVRRMCRILRYVGDHEPSGAQRLVHPLLEVRLVWIWRPGGPDAVEVIWAAVGTDDGCACTGELHGKREADLSRPTMAAVTLVSPSCEAAHIADSATWRISTALSSVTSFPDPSPRIAAQKLPSWMRSGSWVSRSWVTAAGAFPFAR